MINSDDFYGRDAYFKIKEFFDNSNDSECYSMVAFRVINTMTENGSVKRGVCEDKDGYLTNIIESSISKVNDEIIASPLDGREPFPVDPNSLVSMNFFGFTPKMYEALEKGIVKFFDENDLLWANGIFGVYPKDIDSYLESCGFSVTEINMSPARYYELEPGIYIYSYNLDSDKIIENFQIHTVMINITGDINNNMIYVTNLRNKEHCTSKFPSMNYVIGNTSYKAIRMVKIE